MADIIICLGSSNIENARLRALKAVELYRQKKAPILLFSGKGRRRKKMTEAQCMAELALDLGVPQHAVLLEERSRSTLGNAHYSKEILVQGKCSSVILVTDSFHMARALYVFRMTMPKLSIVGIESEPPVTGVRAVYRKLKEAVYLRLDKLRGVRSKL